MNLTTQRPNAIPETPLEGQLLDAWKQTCACVNGCNMHKIFSEGSDHAGGYGAELWPTIYEILSLVKPDCKWKARLLYSDGGIRSFDIFYAADWLPPFCLILVHSWVQFESIDYPIKSFDDFVYWLNAMEQDIVDGIKDMKQINVRTT